LFKFVPLRQQLGSTCFPRHDADTTTIEKPAQGLPAQGVHSVDYSSTHVGGKHAYIVGPREKTPENPSTKEPCVDSDVADNQAKQDLQFACVKASLAKQIRAGEDLQRLLERLMAKKIVALDGFQGLQKEIADIIAEIDEVVATWLPPGYYLAASWLLPREDIHLATTWLKQRYAQLFGEGAPACSSTSARGQT